VNEPDQDRPTVGFYAVDDPAVLRRLIDEALTAVLAHRGGEAYLAEYVDGRTLDKAIEDDVQRGHFLVMKSDGEPVGFTIVRHGIIFGIYVTPTARRQGFAKAFLASADRNGYPIIDGLAMPGDRATKSLYESVGWKARLLTMRQG
jgi:GNAT superfamily N-acetyltransferase